MKAFLIGALIITILILFVFIYAKVEEIIGAVWIYIIAFLIFASFLVGNIAINLFGL